MSDRRLTMCRIINSVIIIVSLFIVGIHCTNDDRIVGGRPAETNEFPYQASLRRSYNGQHFCGGTVISPKHILTAAHCMFYVWGGVLPPMTISVSLGQNKLTLDKNSILRNAVQVFIHEDFNNKNKSNDIAIVQLDKPVPFDEERVAIAALRRGNVQTGTNCTITGWGVTEFGIQDPVEDLLAADVNVIDFNLCEDLYGKAGVQLSSGMMCAGLPDGSKDACQGDSGGPLFCNGLLTGIISTAIGCANAEYPGIYTEVSEYTPWITNILYKTKLWH